MPLLIDTQYMRAESAASYLIIDQGQAAFIETNTTHAAPLLLNALEAEGLGPEAVRWIVVTHVHLDHAGGAGALLQHLPEARLVVHPRGARHLIDPTRLIQGATAVYGQRAMDELYGEIVPAPEERVHIPEDGEVLPLGGRGLVTLHTPGHAHHHLVVLDDHSREVFTGDLFGVAHRALRTPGGPLIFPTTAPPQLTPDLMRQSMERVAALHPSRLLLTHFGAVEDVPRAKDELLRFLKEWEEMTLTLGADHSPGEALHSALVEGLTASVLARYRALGGTLPREEVSGWLALDMEINAQGWEVWLARRQEVDPGSPR